VNVSRFEPSIWLTIFKETNVFVLIVGQPPPNSPLVSTTMNSPL
jgi:hypothetical protein